MILATAAFYPAMVMAQAVEPPTQISDLLVASAARLARTDARPNRSSTETLPFSTMFSPPDHFDRAAVRSRVTNLSIGVIALSLSASRATNGADRWNRGPDAVHWSTKGFGLSANIPLSSDFGLVIGGDYARMSRRLHIVDLVPRRLSTRMARVGTALAFGNESRLSLNYLSIARTSHHDDLTRLTEMIGGAPLTGHGLELAFATAASSMRGGMDWRFSLGAMQRPSPYLGLFDQTALHSDRRAMASLRFHL
ncbi:hypothetical protein [Sphingobium olei]|uniref:Outer membrane protein beta-barrel domain-containing protein n=1 Tax=Sphingobium olei TaxID=420955 RepID=A0ABW3P0H8_9SPHN